MLLHGKRLATIPGLVHGFTDREGGVSQGRYATLNMGGKWGDEPQAVEENRRRVALAGGFSLASLRTVRQVHGAAVLRGSELQAHSEADALWTRREDGHVVAVLTADCVPVLLADLHGRMAAAIHSGWRGTVAGIVPAAVTVLTTAGAVPSELVAAIGPCIGVGGFEVGDEVARQFPETYVDRAHARPHVDLRRFIADQLVSAGLEAQNVEQVGGCTWAEPERYFSYRRDGAGIGQMMSYAGFV